MLTTNDSNRLVSGSGAALVLAAALVLGGPAANCRGQGAAEDAAKFNDAITASKSKLFAAGTAYGTKVGAAVGRGKADDIAQLKVAYVDALLVVRKLRADWKAIKVPDSRTGKDLHAAFDRFLHRQEVSMQADGLELIRITEDKTLTKDQKKTRLIQIIEHNDKKEKEAEAELKKVRQAFAKEHTLKP